MKKLTDEQYDNLTSFADVNGVKLQGYTQRNDKIYLRNNRHSEIYGSNMAELRTKIKMFAI